MGTAAGQTGEILPGVWRFTATHPEWEPGEDWEPEVAWWAVACEGGIVLIDPLLEAWEAPDELVEGSGGCLGVLRTMHWHQRSVTEAAERYGAAVWARRAQGHEHPLDRVLEHAEEPTPGLTVYHVPRDDELVVWLKAHRVLLAGDILLRDEHGRLDLCPESWLRRDRGRDRARAEMRPLAELGAAHVLVGHGPFVLGDGRELTRILGAA